MKPCIVKGKIKYHTKLDAQIATAKLVTASGTKRPYLCPTCGFWHITSKSKSSVGGR